MERYERISKRADRLRAQLSSHEYLGRLIVVTRCPHAACLRSFLQPPTPINLVVVLACVDEALARLTKSMAPGMPQHFVSSDGDKTTNARFRGLLPAFVDFHLNPLCVNFTTNALDYILAWTRAIQLSKDPLGKFPPDCVRMSA